MQRHFLFSPDSPMDTTLDSGSRDMSSILVRGVIRSEITHLSRLSTPIVYLYTRRRRQKAYARNFAPNSWNIEIMVWRFYAGTV